MAASLAGPPPGKLDRMWRPAIVVKSWEGSPPGPPPSSMLWLRSVAPSGKRDPPTLKRGGAGGDGDLLGFYEDLYYDF